MIKNKMNKIILLLYFLTIGTHAYARVITVDQCPVPFDFTIGDFCVLSTLGTMFIIPIIIIAGYIGFTLFTAIISIEKNISVTNRRPRILKKKLICISLISQCYQLNNAFFFEKLKEIFALEIFIDLGGERGIRTLGTL